MTVPRSQLAGPLELAIVIPTFNEQGNIVPLLERLRDTLVGVNWEAVFVDDDSPDGTADAIRELGRTDPSIRVLQRIGRRGLASACIEGMLATAARYIAVIDADLQHDESVLPRMYDLIRAGQLDLVVGSRNIEGGSMGEFAKERVMLSGLGKRLSRAVAKCDLSDPMSGFFIVDRRFFEEVVYRLSGVGFKILVDLVASSRRPVRFAEVPYKFRNRERGESKLDINVGLEYLQLLMDKMTGQVIPSRFVMFGIVGGLGFGVHVSILALLYYVSGVPFWSAQITATFVAMTFNFLLDNITTFRDRRRRGLRLLTGLLIFYVACSIGTMINLAFAEFLLRGGLPWYIAGLLGMAVTSVWNFGVNTIFTWRRAAGAIRRPEAAAGSPR